MERTVVSQISENELSRIVVDTCYKIHVQYGPGLFESVYEKIFCYEWSKLGIPLRHQQGIKVIHQGIDMGIGLFLTL